MQFRALSQSHLAVVLVVLVLVSPDCVTRGVAFTTYDSVIECNTVEHGIVATLSCRPDLAVVVVFRFQPFFSLTPASRLETLPENHGWLVDAVAVLYCTSTAY